VSTTAGVETRCAPLTREQDVDPIGTAGRYDAFVLVTVPAPWPDDIGAIPQLAPVRQLGRRTRVLAIHPEGDATPGGALPLTVWTRTGTHRFTGTDHLVRPGALGEVAAALVAGEPQTATLVGRPTADLLVCGHGRRDRCCGSLGTRVQQAAAEELPGLRVRRCSHTGGHRYAPTGLSLPEGRAWAYLDVDVLGSIAHRTADPASLHEHHRGCSALDPAAQVLERAVFERLGWGWLDHDLTSVGTEADPEDGSTSVWLAWDGPTGPGWARGAVVTNRHLDLLDCGQPWEPARTTFAELGLRSLELGSG
jgi:hypothetical protein